ncbi:MAG TPA: aldo/keto reductase [Rhizomicrobium sp.]|jgi:spore coat polysaccharide biosynthesis protein SpsF|nr:aldo/keto reductase [Rhizomicrobium sp.]
MRERSPAEMVLGTVQLGLAYGAANRTGKPARAAALSLVRKAARAGVCQFDTARAYGDSEDRIGEALAGRKTVRTITKLSPLRALAPNSSRDEVRRAVDDSIEQSLVSLRCARLDCLLLHRAQHMWAFGGAIWERLIERLEDGSILSLGVSVQSPVEALAALACPDVVHLQLPFNLLDWRWLAAGFQTCLATRPNVTVHARSAFLQGILAAHDPDVWPRVKGVDATAMVRMIATLTEVFDRETPADLCLAYVRGQSWIDGVVVGLESEDQLDDNLRLFVKPPLAAEACASLAARIPRMPVALLDPAQWPKR